MCVAPPDKATDFNDLLRRSNVLYMMACEPVVGTKSTPMRPIESRVSEESLA